MNEIRPHKNQSYERLKRQHDSSDLFVDPEFPAIRQSLFPSGRSIMKSGRYVSDVIWRRPTEICDDPKFVVDGFKCGDLDQGEIGNCWFIAAANALSLHDDLRERTVPSNQSFYSNQYAGIFHFRFWSYGQWYDVVVDDQLPWHPDIGLIFCQNSKEKNEMWSALLEKAYAKFCGSYEAVIGGRIEEALIHMTGGMAEVIRLSERRVQDRHFQENLKAIIWQAHHHRSLLGCSISSSSGVFEGRLANGLVQGHAYTITGIADVMTPDGRITIIRCLNPWGNHEEWKGKFSDQSSIWNRISPDEKQKLRLHKRDDGEFWMSLDDFANNFTEIQICHQQLAGFANDFNDESVTWKEMVFHGAWIPGSTAGGCGNGRPENFWKNPQYLIRLNQADDTNGDQLCTMIIFLTLKKPHERHARRTEDEICFQFRLYKILDEADVDESIEQGHFKFHRNQLKLIKDTGTYTNSISLSLRIDAQPGSYIIIPSTFDANTQAEFFFRIFIEAQLAARRSFHEENPISFVDEINELEENDKDEEDIRADHRTDDDDQGCLIM